MLRSFKVVFCAVQEISFLNQMVFGKGHVPFSPLPWILGLPREAAMPPPRTIGRGRAETPRSRQPPALRAPRAAVGGELPASLSWEKGPLEHLPASTSLTGGVRAGLPGRAREG